MPTYDFVCDNCGYGFEAVLGMNERKRSVCEKCGGTATRQFTMPQIFVDNYDPRTMMNAEKEFDLAEKEHNKRLYLEDQIKHKKDTNHLVNIQEV